MAWLATKAKHLTPTLFAEGCRKLLHNIPIIAVHIKPAFRDEILREFENLELPNVIIGSPDIQYEFGKRALSGEPNQSPVHLA